MCTSPGFLALSIFAEDRDATSNPNHRKTGREKLIWSGAKWEFQYSLYAWALINKHWERTEKQSKRAGDNGQMGLRCTDPLNHVNHA